MPAKRLKSGSVDLELAKKRNPGRYASRNDHNTGAAPLGYAPRTLSTEQRAIWRELTRLAPDGLLTSADGFALELAARLIERTRTTMVKASEIAITVSLLGKLGLTPADRARLDLTPPTFEDEHTFDEF